MNIETGSEKGTMGSAGMCTQQGCRYVDHGDHEINTIYLQGEWEQEKQFVRHTSDKEDYLCVLVTGKEVSVSVESNDSAEVDVLVDNKPVPKDKSGKDVKFSGKRSYIPASKGIYNILKLKKAEKHEIKLVTTSSTLKVYKFIVA